MTGQRRRLDLETSLLRIVVGYRVFGAAWLAVLVAITLFGSTDVQRPGVVIGALVLAAVWTAGVVVLSLRNPELLRTHWFVAADVTVAGLTLLAPIIADTGGFTGGYPLAAVFHGVYVSGWAGGMFTASVLTALSVWRVIRGGTSDLTSASADVLSFVFTAAVTAWAIETIRARDAMRLEAEAALAVEQAERLRAEERASLAARIHDGVLQTLALIQRDHDDGAKVASLARRQERELREVLYGTGPATTDGFRSAVTNVASEVEEMTGLRVELVLVGEGEPSTAVDAAGLALREALMNVAKHAGVDNVSVYGEAGDEGFAVFVRDRGHGFDTDDVPPDRRGIAESIVARVEAAGGAADISSDHTGTEVRIVFKEQQ